MKFRILNAGAAVVAVSLALLPASAFAQDGGDGQDGQSDGAAQVQPGMMPVPGGPQVGGEGEQRPPRDFMGSSSPSRGEGEYGDRRSPMASSSDQWGEGEHASSSSEWMSERAQQVSEALQHMSERAKEILGEHFNLNLESATNTAMTSEQLKQLIEQRKEQLDQEEASSTPESQDIVKNANEVRLAVHALLSSKELLGGIGPEVSQIAQDVNASLATSTVAEAQIKSRGFFQKLFFGGDKQAGDALAQTASSTQARIDALTNLLTQASTTADVKATLEAQIQAIQSAQQRLEDLANQQRGSGLLGWLF